RQKSPLVHSRKVPAHPAIADLRATSHRHHGHHRRPDRLQRDRNPEGKHPGPPLRPLRQIPRPTVLPQHPRPPPHPDRPAGRSARSRGQLSSPPSPCSHPPPTAVHAATRRASEPARAALDSADAPPDSFDRHVKWTLHAYPSTQTTPASHPLPLLERATKT